MKMATNLSRFTKCLIMLLLLLLLLLPLFFSSRARDERGARVQGGRKENSTHNGRRYLSLSLKPTFYNISFLSFFLQVSSSVHIYFRAPVSASLFCSVESATKQDLH